MVILEAALWNKEMRRAMAFSRVLTDETGRNGSFSGATGIETCYLDGLSIH